MSSKFLLLMDEKAMLEVMQHLEIQASGALSQQASNRRILPNAVKHQISAQTSSALGPVGVSKPLPKKRRRGGRPSKRTWNNIPISGRQLPSSPETEYPTDIQTLEDCSECKNWGTGCIPDRFDFSGPCVTCLYTTQVCSRLHSPKYNWTSSIRTLLPHKFDMFVTHVCGTQRVRFRGLQNDVTDNLASNEIIEASIWLGMTQHRYIRADSMENHGVCRCWKAAYHVISDSGRNWSTLTWDALQLSFRIAYNPRWRVEGALLRQTFHFMNLVLQLSKTTNLDDEERLSITSSQYERNPLPYHLLIAVIRHLEYFVYEITSIDETDHIDQPIDYLAEFIFMEILLPLFEVVVKAQARSVTPAIK